MRNIVRRKRSITAAAIFALSAFVLSGSSEAIRSGNEPVPMDVAGPAAPMVPAAIEIAHGADLPLDFTTTGSVASAVFGSVALPFRNLPAAARWREVYPVLARGPGNCTSGERCRTRQRALEDTVAKASSARFVDKLTMINSRVNTLIGYASDREIHGKMDYWATPSETLVAGRGDCEDFAILKMAALKAAGVPAKSMSLVILRDRKRDLFHAVLSVTTSQGHFILDNVHDKVLLDTQIARYQPLFSMSQDRYWLHGTRRGGGEDVAASQMPFERIAPGEGSAMIEIVPMDVELSAPAGEAVPLPVATTRLPRHPGAT
jgi:predicted transglutaminase-like cysteine proteinase